MDQHSRDEFGWQQKLGMPLCVLFLLWLNLTLVSNAHAQQPGFVKIQILEGGGNDCQDNFGSDFYFRVTIDDDRSVDTRDHPIHVGFANLIVSLPVNQELQVPVDLSRDIQIRLEQWEKDDSFSFLGDDDDICDIFPGPGNSINVVLNPATCQVSGDVSGACDTTLGFDGFPEHFLFKISVEAAPSAPGLNLRCLHDPIWPKPGETVTITAEVLDGNGNFFFGLVDNIEIWADNMTTPIKTSPNGPSFLQASYAPAGGPDGLQYRCRANDGGEFVSSGWRGVQIGQPDGRAVKIINTGSSNNRVDIVFIVDPTAVDASSKLLYPNGATDVNFLKDVSTAIRDAYYAGSSLSASRATGLLFLQNQDMLNFWIALDPAKATPKTPECPDIDEPDNWNSDYIFADLGVVIHPVAAFERSCAILRRRLSAVFPIGTIANGIPTLLHETGHVPFGLADEYCCNGGYFQFPSDAPSEIPHLDDFPNIYTRITPDHTPQEFCREDELAEDEFGLFIVDACLPIRDNACRTGPKVNQRCVPDSAGQDPMTCGSGISCSLVTKGFRLDVSSTVNDDLMVNNGRPQAADKRRINGFFSICRQQNPGKC